MGAVDGFAMKGSFSLMGLFSAAVTVNAIAQPETSLAGATILVIRHAEKPDSGPDLNDQGNQRAQAYPGYFKDLSLDGKAVKIDAIFASKQSDHSNRPVETVTPLA